MKKIISLFQRNYDGDRLVRDEVVPGAEWVLAGEGTPTRKYDGTCCMIRGGKLFKRYDVKHGRKRPDNFEPAQDPDPITGHWTGWVPVGSGPEDQWHQEAIANLHSEPRDGTYELCGPKVQGNPEGYAHNVFVMHGTTPLDADPRTFDSIRAYLSDGKIEGIVWHHQGGRMVKIKAKDFGIKRAAP